MALPTPINLDLDARIYPQQLDDLIAFANAKTQLPGKPYRIISYSA